MLERTLLEKKVVTKAMSWSAVDLESTVNRQETEKSLLVKSDEGLVSRLLQTTTSGGGTTDKLRKHILSV